MPTVPSISRREGAWLAAVFVCGGGLRLGNLQRVAVEHFDEAVYASNLLFPPDQGGEYSLRQFYAPPLLPAAIEWTTIFGQMFLGPVPTWWSMLPALAAGLATIVSAWWIVRQWMSPRAGILAALLIAFQDYHAAYSRTALTDVPLTLFLLWAVQGFWIALQTGRPRDAVVAGVWTSLAWWTKYNGWLPLAIAAAGGVCWQLLLLRPERNWRRLVQVWGIGSATAFVLWLPVLWDCQKVGGYSQVAENHRNYFSGLSQWIPHLVHGYDNFVEFCGATTLVGFGIAVGVMFLPANISLPNDERRDAPQGPLLGSCLLGAWFWGLFVATPMYHPYSRLWVPWLVAAAIVLAAAISHGRLPSWRTPADWFRSSLFLTGLGCGVLMLSAAGFGNSWRKLPAGWERRDSLWQAAERICVYREDRHTVFIVGDSDPALWHNLRQLEASAFLASTFEFADGRLKQSSYLVLGPLSQRMESIQREFDRRADRFELLEEYPAPLSRVALLDLFSPRDLAQHPDHRVPTVRLYRVKK